ncbi:hypothetical protein BCR43DRAFT_490865 [Syncephalastrum racemosum]|uniref:RRM domain-containing protein n=1 Tax=Syncephalastrum racemosum TaxID=13706 RepID=A0A1X2HGM0_SYNRA|nr:hypothetical protein BCR43DRAFT_490865 [Syncephalastrum racemosum]
MSGKKKQTQKMSLSDFLADESSGSWADEMASLPSAPAASKEEALNDGFSSQRGDRFDRERDFDRGRSGDRGGFERRDRFTSPRSERFAPRAPVELPTEPPFTCHVANLSFDANEDDLADFFAQTKIANIRILRDRDEQRSKGFGYVEFEDLDSLKAALELSGESLQGRTIRVSVAEPPRGRVDRAPREPDRTDVSSWRRDGPVALPERQSRGGFRGGRGGFDRQDRGFERRERDTSWSGGAFSKREGEGRFGRNAPAERPRLNLKPRTSDAPKDTGASSGSKASPFGAARPVDTDTALKRVEEKLSKTTIDEPKSEKPSGQEP